MKKICLVIIMHVSLFFPNLISAKENNIKPLEEILTTEFNKFRPIAASMNISLANLIFSNSSLSHLVNGDSNLIINIKQIDTYTHDSSEIFKSIFCDFVIAHELGHKMQFNGYKKEVINEARGEGIVFLECQADIFAGFFIAELFNINSSEYIKSLGGTMFSVYQTILNMEIVNEGIKTHPTTQERLTAITHGILLGNCCVAYSAILNHNDANSKVDLNEFNNMKDLYIGIGKAINYPYNEGESTFPNPFFWTQNEAGLIIHENNNFASKLIRYDEQINWHTTSNNPTVDFSFKIFNSDTTPVNFSGRVISQIIPRADTKNLVRVGPVDAKVFNELIQPNHSITISGILNWVSDADYMPQVVIPGDESSLYTVFDMPISHVNYSDVRVSDYDFKKWDDNSLDDLSDFLKRVDFNRKNLPDLIKGIGISKESKEEDISSNGVSYDPIFNLGNEKDQKIFLYKSLKISFYSLNLFTSSDSDITKKIFNQIVSRITADYKDYNSSELITEGNSKHLNYFKNRDLVFRVAIKYNQNENNYVVTIKIFGN